MNNKPTYIGYLLIFVGLVAFFVVLSIWALNPSMAVDSKYLGAYALGIVISGVTTLINMIKK